MLDILSRDGKTYSETVEAAIEASKRLKQVLETKILGKVLPAISNVGNVFAGSTFDFGLGLGAAKAEEIYPGGNGCQDTYKVVFWNRWTVRMREIADPGNMYLDDLASFLPREEIEAIFAEHFKNVDIDYLDQESFGRDLRAGGERIDITVDNEYLIEKGRGILACLVKRKAQFPAVNELKAKAEEKELYLALIGAIYDVTDGAVISVPEDEMRVYAHKFLEFFRPGLNDYLFFECGDTVSLRGVIQNVRKSVQADLGSSDFPLTQKVG